MWNKQLDAPFSNKQSSRCVPYTTSAWFGVKFVESRTIKLLLYMTSLAVDSSQVPLEILDSWGA